MIDLCDDIRRAHRLRATAQRYYAAANAIASLELDESVPQSDRDKYGAQVVRLRAAGIALDMQAARIEG